MFLCKAGNKFFSEVHQLNHKSGGRRLYEKYISKYRLLKCDLIPSFPVLSFDSNFYLLSLYNLVS